jgi:hypothetical protein
MNPVPPEQVYFVSMDLDFISTDLENEGHSAKDVEYASVQYFDKQLEIGDYVSISLAKKPKTEVGEIFTRVENILYLGKEYKPGSISRPINGEEAKYSRILILDCRGVFFSSKEKKDYAKKWEHFMELRL